MLAVGQSPNIASSEDLSDLSVCSYECDNAVNAHSTKKPHFHGPVEKKQLMDVYSQGSKTLEASTKGSQSKSLSSEKNNSQIQLKEAQNKVNNKKCAKNTINVSAQKLALTYREGLQNRFSSVNYTLYKDICYPKKEPHNLSNKTKENYPMDVLSLKGTNDTRSCSSKKGREFIEIEVFMPIINSEKNIIMYPKSNKPTVKRYFTEEENAKKAKENIKQCTVSNRKIDERGSKTLQSNVNNSPQTLKNKYGISKTLQLNLMKNTHEALNNNVPGIGKESPKKEIKKDLKKTPEEILNKSISRINKALTLNLKDIPEESPYAITNLSVQTISSMPAKKFSFRSMVENNSLKRKSLVKNLKLDLGRGKGIYTFQNLLKDITTDVRNVTPPTTDAIKNCASIRTTRSFKPACSETTLEAKIKCNLRQENINNSIHGNTRKTPFDTVHYSCVEAKNNSSSPMYEGNKETNVGKINKEKSRDGTIVELTKVGFPRNGKLKCSGKLKQLSLGVTVAGKKEYDSSIRKNHESGWRRRVPPHSEIGGNLTKSKWRPVPENDGLSIASWIERCRYLQRKDVCSHSHRKSSWRPD